MRTPVDILKAGVEQMTPETWTQGLYARGPDGNSCDVFSSDAKCWCSLGWLDKLIGPPHLPTGVPDQEGARLYFETRGLFKIPELGNGLVEFNDTHTFEEVKECWKEALTRAEEIYGPVRES